MVYVPRLRLISYCLVVVLYFADLFIAVFFDLYFVYHVRSKKPAPPGTLHVPDDAFKLYCTRLVQTVISTQYLRRERLKMRRRHYKVPPYQDVHGLLLEPFVWRLV